MTLSEQTNNTTSNTPHVVRRSDSLFPPPPRFLGSFAFIFALCVFVPLSLLPPLAALGGGPFAPVGFFLMASPRPACPFLRGPLTYFMFFLPSSVPFVHFCVPFGASPFWALGFPVFCFCLCVSCFLLFPVVLLCGFWEGPAFSGLVFGSCWLPSLSVVPSPSPAVGPVWLPWSSFHAGTSLWVSGCSCDGSVALPLCWECGCALSSFLHFVSWQQRLLSPVWGCYHPLHHVAGAVRMLSLTTLRYSSG